MPETSEEICRVRGARESETKFSEDRETTQKRSGLKFLFIFS